jgi:hypothetical protein
MKQLIAHASLRVHPLFLPFIHTRQINRLLPPRLLSTTSCRTLHVRDLPVAQLFTRPKSVPNVLRFLEETNACVKLQTTYCICRQPGSPDER